MCTYKNNKPKKTKGLNPMYSTKFYFIKKSYPSKIILT